jgi:hypothetical protein
MTSAIRTIPGMAIRPSANSGETEPLSNSRPESAGPSAAVKRLLCVAVLSSKNPATAGPMELPSCPMKKKIDRLDMRPL